MAIQSGRVFQGRLVLEFLGVVVISGAEGDLAFLAAD
jgi:hypothetical protein